MFYLIETVRRNSIQSLKRLTNLIHIKFSMSIKLFSMSVNESFNLLTLIIQPLALISSSDNMYHDIDNVRLSRVGSFRLFPQHIVPNSKVELVLSLTLSHVYINIYEIGIPNSIGISKNKRYHQTSLLTVAPILKEIFTKFLIIKNFE